MIKGFIFNHNLCVNCNACSAACMLENNWTIHARRIITYNSGVSPAVPLINLSIACNHCEIPVCLDGCPTASYTREPSSGAIIIDDKKCIGCKYCLWNCPFEAPQYDRGKRVIGKCHLCYSYLHSGLSPACANGCPTGALTFGNTDDQDNENMPQWLPGAELNPAIKFSEQMNNIPLKIIPELAFTKSQDYFCKEEKRIGSEWSLVIFSFLTVLSVSLLSSSLINGIMPDKILLLSLTILPGIISLLHLGKKSGAWRAVSNLKSSPLSREIFLYAVYSVITSISVSYELPYLLVASSLTGLLLLISIDAVYIYASRNMSAYFNSGQTFLTALLMISFLSGYKLPFIFVACIKLALSVYGYFQKKSDRNPLMLRFMRITFLFISGASMISGISYPEIPIVALFFAGELADRLIFYLEFEPHMFYRLINNHITLKTNEKERY